MIEGWRNYSIHMLGLVVTGKTPSSKIPGHFGDVIPFVTPTDFSNFQKTVLTTERRLSNSGMDTLKSKILPKNSILVTCIGSQMGKVAINRDIVITNQQLNSIIPNRLVDPDYLYYKLTSIHDELRTLATGGSTMPLLNKSDFERIEVSIPPLPEQHAIASILSALDDKIELNLQMNKTLEEMAMTLYKHWFVDFGPFRDGEFVPSELGEIPKGWETISLGDIAIIKGGKRLPKKEQLQSIPNTHPYIRVRDFNSMYLSLQGMEYVPDNIFPKISSYIVNEGDVLLSIVGTVGSVSIVGDNLNNASLTENSVKVSLLENGLTPELLYLQLISYKGQDEIKQKTVGSTQPKLPIYNIKSLKLSFPRNYGVIGEVSSTIKGWFELIYSNNIENNILITLRDTLLPKLISGEVRVKDAALTIDEAL